MAPSLNHILKGDAMRRITVQVSDDAHKALKLLGIVEAKSFGAVVLDAIEFYLQHKRAYELGVARNASAIKTHPLDPDRSDCAHLPEASGG